MNEIFLPTTSVYTHCCAGEIYVTRINLWTGCGKNMLTTVARDVAKNCARSVSPATNPHITGVPWSIRNTTGGCEPVIVAVEGVVDCTVLFGNRAIIGKIRHDSSVDGIDEKVGWQRRSMRFVER
jgi:hypothetical protein